jgi:hypothetical protein
MVRILQTRIGRDPPAPSPEMTRNAVLVSKTFSDLDERVELSSCRRCEVGT